jgi:hypothetical protein
VEVVASALEKLAERGVFRGFSRGPRHGGKMQFKMLWHRGRNFELIAHPKAGILRFPAVLPEIPPRSSMYREFKEWVAARQSDSPPDHRRVDPKKCGLLCTNQKGNAGVTLKCLDGDWDYATAKLITLVHEIYLTFLNDGRYYEYMIDVFDLDPDHM